MCLLKVASRSPSGLCQLWYTVLLKPKKQSCLWTGKPLKLITDWPYVARVEVKHEILGLDLLRLVSILQSHARQVVITTRVTHIVQSSRSSHNCWYVQFTILPLRGTLYWIFLICCIPDCGHTYAYELWQCWKIFISYRAICPQKAGGFCHFSGLVMRSHCAEIDVHTEPRSIQGVFRKKPESHLFLPIGYLIWPMLWVWGYHGDIPSTALMLTYQNHCHTAVIFS